eukprot:6196298-Pleurochrysis_carterae.AAC.1
MICVTNVRTGRKRAERERVDVGEAPSFELGPGHKADHTRNRQSKSINEITRIDDSFVYFFSRSAFLVTEHRNILQAWRGCQGARTKRLVSPHGYAVRGDNCPSLSPNPLSLADTGRAVTHWASLNVLDKDCFNYTTCVIKDHRILNLLQANRGIHGVRKGVEKPVI